MKTGSLCFTVIFCFLVLQSNKITLKVLCDLSNPVFVQLMLHIIQYNDSEMMKPQECHFSSAQPKISKKIGVTSFISPIIKKHNLKTLTCI